MASWGDSFFFFLNFFDMYTLLYLFIYYIFKKFIFGCAGSLLLHAGFLELQRAGLLSAVLVFLLAVASLWLLLLRSTGSVVATCKL